MTIKEQTKERHTLQKELVYETVQEMHDHPTAQAIYEKLHETHPHISRATVYRILATLAASGKILCVQTPSGANAYDYNTSDHVHLLCRGCGSVTDVVCEMPHIPLPSPSSCYRAEGYSLIFHGLCGKCAAKEN